MMEAGYIIACFSASIPAGCQMTEIFEASGILCKPRWATLLASIAPLDSFAFEFRDQGNFLEPCFQIRHCQCLLLLSRSLPWLFPRSHFLTSLSHSESCLYTLQLVASFIPLHIYLTMYVAPFIVSENGIEQSVGSEQPHTMKPITILAVIGCLNLKEPSSRPGKSRRQPLNSLRINCVLLSKKSWGFPKREHQPYAPFQIISWEYYHLLFPRQRQGRPTLPPTKVSSFDVLRYFRSL